MNTLPLPRRTLRNVGLAAVGTTLVLAGLAVAGDWPQFLGPNRNSISPETGLVRSWTRDGPLEVWRVDVGSGYSGPVIVGDRLILFHRVSDEEVVACLDAATG
jgi:hypothetical protein